MENKKPLAIITGGTSGIGAAYARALAARGYNLVITGRRLDKLAETARELEEKYPCKVTQEALELGDPQKVQAFIDKYKSCEELAFLVNNAGYGSREPFLEDRVEKALQMIEVHNTAVTRIVHAFYPVLSRQKEASLVNVASIMGFYALPGTSMYSATKAFLILFTKALALETRDRNFRIQALCPGLTRTDFHINAPLDEKNMKDRFIVRWMRPEQVVSRSLKDLDRGRIVSIPGFWNRFTVVFLQIIPSGLYNWIARNVV